jgi:hypothetical protein
MELELYFKLGTCSRRAISKKTKKGGKPYNYRPRGDLLHRLSEETGKSLEDVLKQLERERALILERQQ